MKNLLQLALFLISFFLVDNVKAQNTTYNSVDVYNSYGQNATDFVFSYDSNNSCMNNFQVVNNYNVWTSFNFNIVIDNVIIYNGWANVPPLGTVNFDNAFVDCYSSKKIIRINCW